MQVNKIRDLSTADHRNLIVTHTDASELYVWNVDTQPPAGKAAGKVLHLCTAHARPAQLGGCACLLNASSPCLSHGPVSPCRASAYLARPRTCRHVLAHDSRLPNHCQPHISPSQTCKPAVLTGQHALPGQAAAECGGPDADRAPGQGPVRAVHVQRGPLDRVWWHRSECALSGSLGTGCAAGSVSLGPGGMAVNAVQLQDGGPEGGPAAAGALMTPHPSSQHG